MALILLMQNNDLTLITGATGFLGQHIVEEFQTKGLQTLSLGRSAKNDVVCDLAEGSPKGLEKVSVVIHCAALAHRYPKTEASKKEFYNNHIIASENLIKALDTKVCQKFIFISSVAVYGVDAGQLVSEELSPSPNTYYGECKLAVENLILTWGIKNQIPIYILRLPLVVGEAPPGNLGSMVKAIRNKYYVYIKKTNPRRSMVLATDVAKLLSSNQLNEPGIYNLTDGYSPSLREIETCILNKYNVRFKPIGLPFFLINLAAKLGDFFGFLPINSVKLKKLTSDLTFDDQVARTKLNWSPRKVIDGW